MLASEWFRLREMFDFRCGYCGVGEGDAGAELTLDHHRPSSKGGLDVEENYIYCCHACNGRKSDYWSTDPETRLPHPGRERMEDHIREEPDGTLVPLTKPGATLIDRLRLNRPQLVVNRLMRKFLQASQSNGGELLEAISEQNERMRTSTKRISKPPR